MGQEPGTEPRIGGGRDSRVLMSLVTMFGDADYQDSVGGAAPTG